MANEKRLIDANTLKAEFTGNFHELWHYAGIRAMIDVAPTVDAVEVVHCKDCIHCKNIFGARYCEVWTLFNGMGDEGFCNYGERKI